MPAIGLGVKLAGKILSADQAERLLANYANGVSGSFSDNSLVIRDSVTPANDYNGELITADVFNKFTYSRASSATYVGSNGLIQTALTNVPRIHYNPSTLAKLGYLHEGARTNLIFPSVPNTAIWTDNGGPAATNNFGAAPDGTISTFRTIGAGITWYKSAAVISGSTYTASIYIKPPSAAQTIRIFLDGAGVAPNGPYVDAVPATLIATPASGATAGTITDKGNGFYRVTATFTATANSFVALHIYPLSTSSHEYWGAQLELGGAASSYIPTTTAAVTRAADALSLPNTLFNLTQAAGTLYVKNTWDGGSAIDASQRIALSLDDGTGNERHILYNHDGFVGEVTIDGGVVQTILDAASIADGVFTKQAIAYALNDYAFVKDGAAALTDGAATVPTPTALYPGSSGFATAQLFGTIQEFAFIGERVSNVAMQALTS